MQDFPIADGHSEKNGLKKGLNWKMAYSGDDWMKKLTRKSVRRGLFHRFYAFQYMPDIPTNVNRGKIHDSGAVYRWETPNAKMFSAMGIAQLRKCCFYTATCPVCLLEISRLLNLSAIG